ncbi:MAG TPA: adenylate/guanylate cyclase domain-containing protein, partial [Acidimicrobiales bacterium]|nr:adenylate/guanylate cyclase domain-containing protein [Acidimicrobiales bacterium]
MGRGDFVLPVGTVTLLLLDVEGSTKAFERAPEAATEAMIRLRSAITDDVGSHGGVQPVEQGEGDSAVAAFARASDAVACALAIQRNTDVGMRVRIGLHTGEIQLRDAGNYIGGTINRCARIRDLGHGGQVLLSRSTHDLVVDRLPCDASVREMGTHRLRDLARPEMIFQLCHPELDAEFPPLRSLDATPNNLPAQLTSFIGRDDELVQLGKLIAETRLLTVTGAGGCGKTRLALHAAADAIDAYPDGEWFVDLAPLSDPELVVPTLAAVLGIKETPGRDWVDTIAQRLSGHRALVVLDNCEHVIAASAELADGLLRSCPGVTVLATSREPLGVDGEVTWRVPSLTVPDERSTLAVEAMAASDAVRLFIDRATRARPNFAVTNETAPAVAQICQRLDGIPLAIELAAARVRVLSPQQIAAGLDDRFRMLGAGARTAVQRHQTLRASIDSSYDLLTERERVLFRRLAVFAGGFDLDAAEAVCADVELDRWGVLEVLVSLVDRSLVVADEDGDVTRYRMLESIRQYAVELLVSSGEQETLRDRHLERYEAF